MLVKAHLFKRRQIKLKFIFIQCIIKQPLNVLKTKCWRAWKMLQYINYSTLSKAYMNDSKSYLPSNTNLRRETTD